MRESWCRARAAGSFFNGSALAQSAEPAGGVCNDCSWSLAARGAACLCHSVSPCYKRCCEPPPATPARLAVVWQAHKVSRALLRRLSLAQRTLRNAGVSFHVAFMLSDGIAKDSRDDECSEVNTAAGATETPVHGRGDPRPLSEHEKAFGRRALTLLKATLGNSAVWCAQPSTDSPSLYLRSYLEYSICSSRICMRVS